MDSESKALRWVANLRDHFNVLCSDADVIIPQEPIEFVRNQLVAVGESLKQFCADLLQDSLGEKKLDLPSRTCNLRSKENGDCIGTVEVEVEVEVEASEPCKTSGDQGVLLDDRLCSVVVESPEETEQTGNLAEEHVAPEACKISDDRLFSVVVESPEETEQTGNLAEEHVAPKACKISDDDELTSSIHSFGFSEGEEAEDSSVFEPSGGKWFTQNPTGWQKLLGSDDEFCSDFDVEKTNNHLRRTASFKEWDEDLCDSDWEII